MFRVTKPKHGAVKRSAFFLDCGFSIQGEIERFVKRKQRFDEETGKKKTTGESTGKGKRPGRRVLAGSKKGAFLLECAFCFVNFYQVIEGMLSNRSSYAVTVYLCSSCRIYRYNRCSAKR